MTRPPGLFGFNSKDRYIEELLENQEKELKELRKEPEEENERKADPYMQENPLSKKETTRLLGSALAGALLVGAAFMGVLFLFLLFCVNVWFA